VNIMQIRADGSQLLGPWPVEGRSRRFELIAAFSQFLRESWPSARRHCLNRGQLIVRPEPTVEVAPEDDTDGGAGGQVQGRTRRLREIVRVVADAGEADPRALTPTPKVATGAVLSIFAAIDEKDAINNE
jgi:hypothetical protein